MPRAHQVLSVQLAEPQHAPIMAAGVHNGVDGTVHVAKDELVVPCGRNPQDLAWRYFRESGDSHVSCYANVWRMGFLIMNFWRATSNYTFLA